MGEGRIVPTVTSFVSVKAVIVFGLTLTANWRKPIVKNELKEQILGMNKNRNGLVALVMPTFPRSNNIHQNANIPKDAPIDMIL